MPERNDEQVSNGRLYLVIASLMITIPFLIYRFLVLERLTQVLSE
jgi:hypothetical protein